MQELEHQAGMLALLHHVHQSASIPKLALVACMQVLYKLDKYGNGEEICLDDLPLNHGISFLGFSHNMFLEVGTELYLQPAVRLIAGAAMVDPVQTAQHCRCRH
jgi:hypothetical protein